MTSSINEKIKEQIKAKKLQEKIQVSDTGEGNVKQKPVVKTVTKKSVAKKKIAKKKTTKKKTTKTKE